MASDVDHCEQEVAQLVVHLRRRAVQGCFADLGGLLRDLGECTLDGGPVETHLRGLALDGVGVAEGGQRVRHPFEHRRAPFLHLLDRVPVGQHSGGVLGDHLVGAIGREHVRMATHELVVHTPRHVGHGETALLLRDGGVELDLVQQVAEFLDEVLVGVGVVGVERLQRVHHLVGLLQQVAHERLVGLLLVPRALLAQRAGELVEANQLGADRCGQVGDVDAGEVVGLDRSVEVGPCGVRDEFVGCAEALQDDHRFVAGGPFDGQFDVAQHPVGVRVGHQQRAGRPGRCGGELVSVDHGHAGLDGVDAEARIRKVEERHRGVHDALDARVGTQEPHGALEDQRRAGHCVQHLTVLLRGGHQAVGDLGVHRRERVGSLVDVIERGRVWNEVGAGVHRCAQKALRDPSDLRPRVVGDVLGATRAEPDDGDPRSAHSPEYATTSPVVGSHTPKRELTDTSAGT